MSLWRRTRNEVAGAWRSLRYDLGRPVSEADPAGPGAGGFAEVTSTGLSTFGGAGVTGCLRTGPAGDHMSRPRRLVAVSAFGALAAAGAAGSYFAVVNGVGSLAGEQVGTEPYPLAAEAPPVGDLSHSGLGRGTAVLSGQPAPATEVVPGQIRVLPMPSGSSAAGAGVVQPRPRQTTVAGRAPEAQPAPCDCLTPPVPTPTAPVPMPYSPSAPPPPSASPEESESPEPSGPPDGTAEPSASATAEAG
jgi:hypothetical protein